MHLNSGSKWQLFKPNDSDCDICKTHANQRINPVMLLLYFFDKVKTCKISINFPISLSFLFSKSMEGFRNKFLLIGRVTLVIASAPLCVKSHSAFLLHLWDERSQSKFPLIMCSSISNASKQNNPLIQEIYIYRAFHTINNRSKPDAQILINKLKNSSILNGFLLDKMKKILRSQERIWRIRETMIQQKITQLLIQS